MSDSLTIIIPTINEAEGITSTINKIQVSKLRAEGYNVEVLVVDGGSTDNTAELAETLGARVIIERTSGYGRAYKTGFLHAKGDIIVTLDGDDTYPAELIPKLVRYLSRNKLNFVNTSRFWHGLPTSMPLANRMGNRVLSFTCRILFNMRMRDSQSGMWIFRRSILKDIMPNSDGMPFSEEIKVKACLNLEGVTEVPIPYRARIGSSKLRIFSDGIGNLLYLLKLLATRVPHAKADLKNVR